MGGRLTVARGLIRLRAECIITIIAMRRSFSSPLPGHAVIRYNNLGSAVYAKEKLTGFEYPPGNRLAVSFIDDGEDRNRYARARALRTK